MGNVSSLARASSALDSYVAELGTDVSYEKSLSSSRFLKTILIRHNYGLLVLKLFIKPDPYMSLRVIQRRLKHQRDALTDLPNVLAYATFVETEKAGYLIRQYAGASLYDRISTRPYLAPIEKKWISFQILCAMRDSRARDITHGDLKSENILITPALTILITDYASSFKPTFLPLNDPSDFSYFYDSSGRRTCYIAPERFYTEDSRIAEEKRQAIASVAAEGTGSWLNAGIGKRDGKVTEEMDVFAAGCVLLEMWTDGASIFTLSELYAYREGKYSELEGILGSIEDTCVRTMISSMIAVEAEHRPTFEKALSDFRNTVFPDYFYTFMADYVLDLAADHHVPNSPATNDPIAKSYGQADSIVSGICRDWDGIIAAMVLEHDLAANHTASDDTTLAVGAAEEFSGEDLDAPTLLLLNIITSNIRNCIRESSKVDAMSPLRSIASRLTADEVIDRLVPYLVALFKDESAQVRAASFELLVQVFTDLEVISAHNSGIITEYIMPHIRQLGEDEDVLVRATFARYLPQLSDIGLNIMEMTQALKIAEIGAGQIDMDQTLEPGYDATMAELLDIYSEQASTVLVDSSSDVRRAALADVAKMCLAFGRSKTNEVLLSRMITYLNDKDWKLRYAFLENIVSVAAFVGSISLEEFVLPLMEQALADPEDFVVARVLDSLASLSEIRLFDKPRMLELFSNCYGFLVHPSAWVRQAAASFIASVAKQLTTTDVSCLIYPYLRPLLQADLADISQMTLLDSILPPLPRELVESGKIWASRGLRGPFWSKANVPGRKGPKTKAFHMRQPLTKASLASPDEKDKRHLEDLRKRGLEEQLEIKFLTLRDYMASQTALAIERGVASSSALGLTGKQASLQELNVTPVTVFLTPKRTEPPANIAMDKLRNPTNRVLSDDSRRSSFSGVPFRPRIPSQNISSGDVHNVTELRRKLKRLDEPRTNSRDLHMTSTPTARSANQDNPSNSDILNQTAPSNASMPSTLQDRTNGLLQGRGRLSFGREAAKAAPAVSATTEVVLGQLELATTLDRMEGPGLASGLATPGQPIREVHPPPIDPSQPFVSTYEGHDPNVLALLERTYAENVVAGLHHLGPILDRVPESRRMVPNRARQASTRLGEHPPSLIAHLSTHRSPVVRLMASPDLLYLLSVETDGLICIWDVARFERSVTAKPRSTFLLEDGKVTAVCSLRGRSAFAFALSNGTIQLARISHASSSSLKQVRVVPVQRLAYPSDIGSIIFIQNVQQGEQSDLLFVTSLGQISLMSIRSSVLKWTATHPISLGRVTASYLDSKQIWLLTGTSSGHLALWDLRYGLLIREWRVSKTGICTIAGHPSRGSGKWVIIASEGDHHIQPDSPNQTLMTTIDLSNGEVVERFQSSFSESGATSAEATGGLAFLDTPAEVKTAAQTIEELLECNTSAGEGTTESQRAERRPRSSIRAIHVLDSSQGSAFPGVMDLSPVQESFDSNPGVDKTAAVSVGPNVSGMVLTASSDRIVRLWNLGRPSESLVVSGAGKDANKRFKYHHSATGVPTYLEFPARQPESRVPQSRAARKLAEDQPTTAPNGVHTASLSKPHLHEIAAILPFSSPFSNAMLIATGDAAGIIKIWKVEA